MVSRRSGFLRQLSSIKFESLSGECEGFRNFIEYFTYQDHAHFRKGIADNLTWSFGMSIHIIPSEVRCFGDAMRELDAKGHFRGDFILMNFDTITNAKIIPSILKAHKENCKVDKGTAMTCAYKVVSPTRRTGNEVVVAVDRSTKRMLFHQRLHATIKETKFKLPMEMFDNSREIEIHHDYMDPHLAICSANALPLFQDNFDYETRDHFIRGLVMNQEITTDSIYAFELPRDEYAARVSDWKMYDIVSKDIMNRWVYPLVPDMGISYLSPQYSFHRNNIYRHMSVKVDRNSSLNSDVVLSEGAFVDSKSTLLNCVLGKNCRIGKNCSLANCYVFDNTMIGDNCTLANCIIGRNVRVAVGCNIENGTVIADNCVISKNSRVSGLLVVSQVFENDDYSNEDFEKLGENAYKILEKDEEDDDFGSDADLAANSEFQQKFTKLSLNECHYESSNYSSRNESDDEEEGQQFQQEDSAIFFSEVVESLKRGFDEKSNAEFLILEINSSRYAYNMALNEVNFYVVKAALNLPAVLDSTEPIKGFMQVYAYLGEKVIKNYIKGDSSQNDCLNAIVECCEEHEKMKQKLMHFVKFMYDRDVLTEDGIVSWYEDVESEWVRKALQPMIKWLEEAESEESD